MHPGCDGGPDQGDQHDEIAAVHLKGRADRLKQDLGPRRVCKEGGDHVQQVKSAGDQEDPLDSGVGPLHHEPGDQEGGEGNGEEPGHAEDLKGSGRPGEFSDGIGEIGEDENRKDQNGGPDPVALPNELPQTLSGDHAHPTPHLLDHGEADGGKKEGPEQAVAVLGPGQGVSGDPTGVLVHAGGDDPRPHDGQKDEEPPLV